MTGTDHRSGDMMSDARMFDVAKGVLIGARRYSLDHALTELIEVAHQHQVGVLALAQALVALAVSDVSQQPDEIASNAATAAWGQLFFNVD